MSTKRTPIDRPHRRIISEQAITLFRHILGIDPGTREYFDLSIKLDELFDRRPWHESIMWVSSDMDPNDIAANDDHDIVGAIEIRRALEALA